MILQHPEYLWALAALPLMWWLSRPPAPRRRVWTGHLEQWQLAMQSLRRRPPRGSWLRFVLLAVALIAAAFAAAGAQAAGRPGPQRLVVLLDASASMAAERDGVSAFDRARQKLAERLRALPAHVEVVLLRCGGDLRRRYGEAARNLNDVGRPSGELAVDLAELADSLRDAGTEVWVCTD
ncbi:MAG: VWA domain-containing protein, partial [Planctomycetota bacterium]|nr:VWA domain-containing protein [Planctomycetota bacterium]